MTYNSRGMRTRIDYPSGLWHETQYDANGRPTEIRDEGAFGKVVENYTYDANGNRRTISSFAGVLTTFTYDQKDRLTQDNSTGPDAHVYNYTFDSRDNLLTTNESGTLTTMVYDAASRLVTSTAGTTVTTFTYDPNGNMTQTNVGGTITTMVYNEHNQLFQHTAGGVNHYNTWDGFGYLRSVTRDSTLQWYSYMDGPNVVGEWIEDTGTEPGRISKLYMLDDGLTILSEFIDDFTLGTRQDYIVDFLGSVRGYTLGNDTSTIQEPTRYKPFGGVLSGGITLSYGWTGNTGSRQTGLSFAEQYNRARFYSTRTRQWTTVELLWPMLPAYGYASGRPTVLIDWNGASPVWPYGAPPSPSPEPWTWSPPSPFEGDPVGPPYWGPPSQGHGTPPTPNNGTEHQHTQGIQACSSYQFPLPVVLPMGGKLSLGIEVCHWSYDSACCGTGNWAKGCWSLALQLTAKWGIPRIENWIKELSDVRKAFIDGAQAVMRVTFGAQAGLLQSLTPEKACVPKHYSGDLSLCGGVCLGPMSVSACASAIGQKSGFGNFQTSITQTIGFCGTPSFFLRLRARYKRCD